MPDAISEQQQLVFTQLWINKRVLGEDEARPFVKRALELGINFFDTANGYSAGTIL